MIIDILALNWLTYANDSKNYTHMAPRPHKFLKYFWLKFETFGVFTVQHAFACYLPHSWGRQRKMCVHAHITIHFLHISLIRNTLGIVPHMCSSLLCWFPCFFFVQSHCTLYPFACFAFWKHCTMYGIKSV